MINKQVILRSVGFFLCCFFSLHPVFTQEKLTAIRLNNAIIVKALFNNKEIVVAKSLPLFSFQLKNEWHDAAGKAEQITIEISDSGLIQEDLHFIIRFRNISHDTLTLHNVIPFTRQDSEAFITGVGDHPLSRTHLHLPGKIPVNVIVPDNAWELGFNAITIPGGKKIAALTRRDPHSLQQGRRQRFETILYPGGSVRYHLYITGYSGEWQQALTTIFQKRMLYDIDHFNNEMFERKDLQWIRRSYVIHLMDAWDKQYYDYTKGKYTLDDFIKKSKPLYGGDDVIAIWPTWPTLGLDQRNQFDMYRDLPGGTAAMKNMAELSRSNGAKFFICYNPWDESTRKADHLEGLSELISETSADGVILDTKGESSKELQHAADKVRTGVVMYSEGMAVPKNMEDIVSGRVHNALTHPPLLNLNKFIKPEFAIFRVSEINKGKITRDLATSFFNGYGTEINIMGPGIPYDIAEQYRYLGRTSRILRENTTSFTAGKYTPLIPVAGDSIWVNEWQQEQKTIYTVFNVKPQGHAGPLFTAELTPGFHWIDLWRHRPVSPLINNGELWIPADVDAFNISDLGSDNEGSVSCIAKLPELISASRYGDELTIEINNDAKGDILLWAGAPDYTKQPVKLNGRKQKQTISIGKLFGRLEGDIVIQLMNDGILSDEKIITIKPGTPVRISSSIPSKRLDRAPKGMVNIPAGKFRFTTTHGDEFIGYPAMDEDSLFEMTSFFMDKFPVTNQQFKTFIKAANYHPADTVNFLKHWKNGEILKGEENYPVVYISYEDAQAYAAWAGKRLPTEVEWQYAAQTTELRGWPWIQSRPVTRKEEVVNETLTVTSLQGIDSSKCNPGNGKLYPVGAYPKGVSKFGLYDLVGCVWQLTNDVYETASHRYIIMKGGSYFRPSSSWWYVQSGPRELHYRQFLLRVSNGFERNATVGFRCVADKMK